MCFGGGPQRDDTALRMQQAEAAEARAREERRAARIREGSQQIDQQFAKFDDPFFAQRREAVMNFYQPQLDNQFTRARENLTNTLARSGLVNSSIAGDRNSQLLQDYDTQRAGVLSRATGEENSLRSRVNSERSALVSQLNATADSDRAANEALARTQTIAQIQPSYDMLPDVFGGVAQGIGSIMSGFNNQRILEAGGLGARSPRRDAQTFVNG